MAKLKMTSKIISQEMISPDIYSMWLSAKEIAGASKKQSETAEYVAHKADVKGWIAIFISLVALGIEFMANYDEI